MPKTAFSEFKRALGSRAETAEAWYAIGVGRAILGHLDDSRRAFEQAVSLRPGYWWVHYCLGLVLSDAGERSLAEPELDRALHGLPGDARVARAVGLVRAGRGDLPGAAAVIEAALGRGPSRHHAATLRLDLSRIYRSLGREKEALGEIEEAVRLRPADARLRVKLGTTYLASGDRERAAGEFEKALELSPGLVSEIMGRALRSEGGQ